MKNDNDALQLRDVNEDDLSVFYGQQLDPSAIYMAAFTAEDPTNRKAFDAHWQRILADKRINVKTIVFQDQIAGHIACFERLNNLEVSYWIGRDYWGKGIATDALSEFLMIIKTRPLFARTASDNAASIRVLEKCGFHVSGYDKAFAHARGEETEEIIFILEN